MPKKKKSKYWYDYSPLDYTIEFYETPDNWEERNLWEVIDVYGVLVGPHDSLPKARKAAMKHIQDEIDEHKGTKQMAKDCEVRKLDTVEHRKVEIVISGKKLK